MGIPPLSVSRGAHMGRHPASSPEIRRIPRLPGTAKPTVEADCPEVLPTSCGGYRPAEARESLADPPEAKPFPIPTETHPSSPASRAEAPDPSPTPLCHHAPPGRAGTDVDRRRSSGWPPESTPSAPASPASPSTPPTEAQPNADPTRGSAGPRQTFERGTACRRRRFLPPLISRSQPPSRNKRP